MRVKYNPEGELRVPKAMGADPEASERFFIEKGIEAELRKMGRQNRRAANRAYRQSRRSSPDGIGYYDAEPSNIENLLTGLDTGRFDEGKMLKKGFRNQAGRLLAMNALGALFGYGLGKYNNTDPFGELTVGQRLGKMFGLGPR